MEPTDIQVHKHDKTTTTTDTTNMNVIECAVEEFDGDTVDSQSECDTVKQSTSFEILDTENGLVAEYTLSSSILADYTIKVCWRDSMNLLFKISSLKH